MIEQEEVNLTYECSFFEPQAETLQKTHAVLYRTHAALKGAREEGDATPFRALA